jgi:hypothetical protein
MTKSNIQHPLSLLWLCFDPWGHYGGSWTTQVNKSHQQWYLQVTCSMSKSQCNEKFVMEKIPYIANINICQHLKLYFTYKLIVIWLEMLATVNISLKEVKQVISNAKLTSNVLYSGNYY